MRMHSLCALRAFGGKTSLEKHSNNHPGDHETQKTTGERKHTLSRLALASQQRTHDRDATLPTIVLVKWKNVAGCQQQIQPTKYCSVSKKTRHKVEDDSAEVHEELSAHRLFLQGGAIERDERADGYRAQTD